ncbi:MAG: hypothetical protein SH850_22500 [Planctomycetaceae bacterium]|nr:hypothetical protein [Planctomycetaceae bacterium]
MASIWQIGSGELGRKYTDLFLEHDVMFCGPSEFGPFNEANYSVAIAKGWFSPQKIGQVRAFATQVQPGDLVLLRSGHQLISIGVVDSCGYAHNPTFDDIYGWDLEHTHRVIWQEHFGDEIESLQKTKRLFAGRKQIPTFTGVGDDAVLDPIRHLFGKCVTRPLKTLPPPPSKAMSLDEFGEALFSQGVAFDAVRKVKMALEKQRRLLDWYRLSGLATNRPSEHEIVAHVILPLMSALGWSEQLLAVEWHKIDLAVFWGTPTDKEHCELICEAKAMGHGLQGVLKQAIEYADKHALTSCKKILLADGGRFYLYKRNDGGWGTNPVGYLNVQLLRSSHVIPKGTNAVDTLVALTPAHLGR